MRVKLEDSSEFLKNKGYKIASISHPENHSIVYIMRKIQDKLTILSEYNDCFVFFQAGIDIPNDLEEKHIFCESDDASKSFAEYVQGIMGEKEKSDRKRKYIVTPQGYTIGEGVEIGENTFIEAGVFIDHDVIIGNDCVIKREAMLRHCVVGDRCVICERAFVGNTPYTYHEGENCMERTLAVGKVYLDSDVDVGAYSIIDRGSVTNTRIGYGTKVDSNVYIGHDVLIGKNVEITSGSLVGGFSEIGDEVKIYTANIMKRTTVSSNAVVGFGACVISDVKEGAEVFGNPARTVKSIQR